MPQMLIDEAALGEYRFDSFVLPIRYWTEMVECVDALGYDVTAVGMPPRVLVAPAVRTIRVHDMTIDSLNYAGDSTHMGEEWSAPTIGFAMVRSNVVIVTEEYRINKYLLRHEALHHIMWRIERQLNHDPLVFLPCGDHYE
jgi:hypothetical protein